MRIGAAILATMLCTAPLGARAADLVIWWEKGSYPQEDEAVAEIIAAFEQDSGKQVDLVLHGQYEIGDQARAALEAGEPPDFLYLSLGEWITQWAYEGKLLDLQAALGPVLDLIMGTVIPAVVFRDGDHVATAEAFVRFLVAEGWLAHYLDFSAERMLPPMQKLLDQPFWLDPSDPHRMAGVMQVSSRPVRYEYAQALGNWRHDAVWQEFTWAKAIHRVAAEGISPEQAVDEAIARIKQILAE